MTGPVPTSDLELAEELMSRAAEREMIPHDPSTSGRWHTHGVPSRYSRWNAHPEYEIHLMTKTTGRFVVGDHVGTFGPGHLVIIGSNVPHHFISDLEPAESVPNRDVVFQFHPEWLTAARAALPELDQLDDLLAAARRGVEFGGRTAELGATELCRIGETTGPRRLEHIFGLLALLGEAPEHERTILARAYLPVTGDLQSAALVDRVFTYILENLDHDVRLSAAASQVGLSESALSRQFARACGQTFTDTVRKLRLAQAGKLLLQTTLPIAVIPSRVGYRNLSNFNRQFLAMHGTTPSEYRRRRTSGAAGLDRGHPGRASADTQESAQESIRIGTLAR